MIILASILVASVVTALGYLLFWRCKTYGFVNATLGTRVTLRLGRAWRRKADPSARIMFTAPDGSVLQITPFPKEASQMLAPKLDQAMLGLMHETLKDSLETVLEPRVAEGPTAMAMYICSTDRNVKLGEWRYKASGFVVSGEMLATFTILSHFAPPLGIAVGLDALMTIKMSSQPGLA